MKNEQINSNVNINDNPWDILEKELESEKTSDLEIFQEIPLGSTAFENITYSEEQKEAGRKFERQVDEIINISRNNNYDGSGELNKADLARSLYNDNHFNKYAIAAALGPSTILDVMEETPNALGDFDMGAFVAKISDKNLDRDTSWGLLCRTSIATELDRYSDPKLGVNIENFVYSEDTNTKFLTLEKIINSDIDFNVEEFLATVCEDEPTVIRANTNNYLKLGIDFPAPEIERKLQVETREKIKDEEDNEWKKYLLSVYEEDIETLMETYDDYGKLSDREKETVNRSLNNLHKDITGKSRESEKEIVLDEILQDTIESYNDKYKEYRDKYIDLNDQYYKHILTVDNFHEEQKKLAKNTITTLNDKELSYFRREFIRRSYLYEGSESYNNCKKNEDERLSEFYEYDVFHNLYKADEKFLKSDEYKIYRKHEEEQKRANAAAEINNMSDEELKKLRTQRLEYEAYNTYPVQIWDENNHRISKNSDIFNHIKELWKADTGWEKSEEYKTAEKKKVEKWTNKAANEWAELIVKYPDIFTNPDLEEINKLVEGTLNKIPQEKIDEIIKLKQSGEYRKADQAEIDLLVNVFGLDYRPYIEYSSKDTDCNGSYSDRLKNVTIRRQFGGRDDENKLTNTIAHEMWHAHQHDEVEKKTERGKMYEINNKHYQNGQPGWDLIGEDAFSTNWDEAYTRYKNQLLEVEAFTFGKAFADLYKNIAENGTNQ